MKFRNFIILFIFPFSVLSQSLNSSFSFLNTEISSRSLAMGGDLITIYDNDILLAQKTPSILNADMNNELGFSFVDYFSDISLVSFNYAKNFKKIGCLSLGFISADYGNFSLTNEVGEQDLSFSSSDQIINFGYARKINQKINLGFNINFLNSSYERYKSSSITSNISTTYYSSENNFNSTLLFKNIGRQLKGYTSLSEKIPFEIQFGISKKLEHLPFRYSIVLNNLNKFDISNDYSLNSFTNNESGEIELVDESFAKTILRHIIISGELNLFNDNLYLRGGFNFQRRFNMTIDSYGGLVGFSFGVGMKVSKINLSYSRSSYHLSGQLNSFSFSTNLSTFGI